MAIRIRRGPKTVAEPKRMEGAPPGDVAKAKEAYLKFTSNPANFSIKRAF